MAMDTSESTRLILQPWDIKANLPLLFLKKKKTIRSTMLITQIIVFNVAR